MASTNPARGMRDFLPSDVRKRNYVIGIIKEVYESYGFEPLETPAVENIETLMGKYGDEGNQLIFKILKRGEKLEVSRQYGELADLALRYDLTVPLARVVADRRNDLPKFFKRYQIQPVWRADRPARGRFREFYQCDVDAIGSSSVVVEAELISAVSEILTRLDFDDFVIRVNHRAVLSGMLNASGIPEYSHLSALTAVDKLDKSGSDAVRDELAKKGFESESIDSLLDFLIKSRENAARPQNHVETLHHIANFLNDGDINRSAGQLALAQIEMLLTNDKAHPHLRFDASLARGLSYYTGTIMEINVPDLAGSLGGGGRYDGLIGMFGKEQIPACGFSLGLERILVVMEERRVFQKLAAQRKLELEPADVMIATVDPRPDIGIVSQHQAHVFVSLPAEALKLANELRSQGLRVLLYPETDKLGKQVKYADSINIPWICVLGDSEIAENKVTLKNMASGEQKTLERDKVAEEIKSLTATV